MVKRSVATVASEAFDHGVHNLAPRCPGGVNQLSDLGYNVLGHLPVVIRLVFLDVRRNLSVLDIDNQQSGALGIDQRAA
ncbi:hypothetical protein D3C84_945440 [compost metagenome]